ncbi:MAG: hypothetical protein JKX97_08655 [Candidatus Lindowbacteria bacterium]|nr:hypothetical protein [Candidatus Lindowbacteria bacterium]
MSHKALARYYYLGNGDDYAQFSGGFGRGAEFIGNTNVVRDTRNHAFGFEFQKYFTDHWGVNASVGYGDEAGGQV